MMIARRYSYMDGISRGQSLAFCPANVDDDLIVMDDSEWGWVQLVRDRGDPILLFYLFNSKQV